MGATKNSSIVHRDDKRQRVAMVFLYVEFSFMSSCSDNVFIHSCLT